ncbi:MAG TPA: hypothetical protein DCS93_05790 [Microscillaceae bacterium]|nr:hypothetical protein [Microscillaceae bacterium]
MIILTFLLYVLGGYLALAVGYYSLFCWASLFFRNKSTAHQKTDVLARIVLLIPAYKEDAVIERTVQNVLQQDYDHRKCDVVVIADQLQKPTLDHLRKLPIQVVEVHFQKSTKAKALNFALKNLTKDYDLAMVLDADNHLAPGVLQKINQAYQQGHWVIQAHRTAKNHENDLAQLDAISEELNNAIFRKGHQVLGLPAALIGSGMAMQHHLHKQAMASINAIGGFDKELELSILKNPDLPNPKVHYLADALVYDEKVSNAKVFRKQRTRWISSQVKYGLRGIKDAFQQLLLKQNIAYFNKVLQFWLPPRLLLLGSLALFSLVGIFIQWSVGLYFGSLLLTLIGSLIVALPARLRTYQTLWALGKLPLVFLSMLKAIFHLRQGFKSFLPTPHQYSSKP